jgi:hypothetical protein
VEAYDEHVNNQAINVNTGTIPTDLECDLGIGPAGITTDIYRCGENCGRKAKAVCQVKQQRAKDVHLGPGDDDRVDDCF